MTHTAEAPALKGLLSSIDTNTQDIMDMLDETIHSRYDNRWGY